MSIKLSKVVLFAGILGLIGCSQGIDVEIDQQDTQTTHHRHHVTLSDALLMANSMQGTTQSDKEWYALTGDWIKNGDNWNINRYMFGNFSIIW